MGSEATMGKATVIGGDVVVYQERGGGAELLGRDKSVASRHLRNVFASGELRRKTVVAVNATTAADGKTYQIEYFNLDAILSVGYRVNSKRGTQFRIWATRSCATTSCAATRSTSDGCVRRASARWSRPWVCSRVR